MDQGQSISLIKLIQALIVESSLSWLGYGSPKGKHEKSVKRIYDQGKSSSIMFSAFIGSQVMTKLTIVGK